MGDTHVLVFPVISHFGDLGAFTSFCFQMYVEYVKTGCKTFMLIECDNPLSNLLAFLKQEKIGAAPTLRQLWLRIKFHLASLEFDAVSTDFQAVLEGGLARLGDE